MRLSAGWILAAMIVPASAQAAGSYANEMQIRVGQTISQEQCSACHAVAGSGSGSDAAPSFAAVAMKRDDAFLRSFLAKPHGNMPMVDLTNAQVDAIIAYIGSLKK